MEATEANAVAVDPVALVCFEVAGRSYAIDVSHMREVVRWQPTTPLPNAPPPIAGVLDLRDLVVPVLDMGLALGGAPVQAGPNARILVIEFDEMLVGLAVEAATDVLSLPPSGVDALPAFAQKAGYEAVGAVVRRAQAEPILVLRVDQLLSCLDRASPPHSGAER